MEYTVRRNRNLSHGERDRYSILSGMVKRLGPDACYFSIPLPYQRGIQEAQKRALSELQAISYDPVPPHQYHITLVILPDCPGDRLEAIVREVAYDLPAPFDLTVSALDSFPDAPSNPLIARVNPSPALLRLQERIVNAARRQAVEIGPYMNFKDYKPHITLAVDVVPARFEVPDLPNPLKLRVGRFVASREHYQVVADVQLAPPGVRPVVQLDNITIQRGGPGSGHHGHRGRPGKVGGSLPRGAAAPAQAGESDDPFAGLDFSKAGAKVSEINGVRHIFGEEDVEAAGAVRHAVESFEDVMGVELEGLTIFSQTGAYFMALDEMGMFDAWRKQMIDHIKSDYAPSTAQKYISRVRDMSKMDILSGVYRRSAASYVASTSPYIYLNRALLPSPGSKGFNYSLWHEMAHHIDELTGEEWMPLKEGYSPAIPYKYSERVSGSWNRSLGYKSDALRKEYFADLLMAYVGSKVYGTEPKFSKRMGFRMLDDDEQEDMRELLDYIEQAKRNTDDYDLTAKAGTDEVQVLLPMPDGTYEGVSIPRDEAEQMGDQVYILEDGEDLIRLVLGDDLEADNGNIVKSYEPEPEYPEEEVQWVVSRDQMMALLRGEHIVVRPLGRILTLTDGPFEIAERHYGPGTHPGTHTEQQVHAGDHPGGIPATPEKIKVSKDLEALMREIEEGEHTEKFTRDDWRKFDRYFANKFAMMIAEGEIPPLHTLSKDDIREIAPRSQWTKEAYEKNAAKLDLESARYKMLDRMWNQAMGAAISEGRMTYQEAEELGYYHQEMSHEKLKPLPDTLYHVTTARDAVLEQGLKSRFELSMDNGTGLGGGDDMTISFTDDPDTANTIYHGIVEAQMVARGEITVRDMLEMARTGEGTEVATYERLLIHSFTYNKKWDHGDPLPRSLDGILRGVKIDWQGLHRSLDEQIEKEGEGWRVSPRARTLVGGDGVERFNMFERDLTPEEQTNERFRFYKTFAAVRQWVGGPEDPLFFGSDPQALAAVDTDQIAIIETNGNGYGWQMGALGEWRTMSGRAVSNYRPREPGPRKTRGEIWGKSRWADYFRDQFTEYAEEFLQEAEVERTAPFDPTRFSLAMLGQTVAASGPGITKYGDDLAIEFYENMEAIPVGTEFMVLDHEHLRGIYRMDQNQVLEREEPPDHFRILIEDLIDGLEESGYISMIPIDLQGRLIQPTGFPQPLPVQKKPGRRIEPWVYAEPTSEPAHNKPKVEFELSDDLSVGAALAHLPLGSMFEREYPDPNWATGKWVRMVNRDGEIVWRSIDKGLEAYDSEWGDLFDHVGEIKWLRLLRPYDVEELAEWAHRQADLHAIQASYRVGDSLTDERGRPFEKDDYFLVYHGTSVDEAERLVKHGAVPETKPTNPSRLRYEAGVEMLPHLIGQPLSNRVYVTARPHTARQFGEAVVAMRVRERDLAISPEVMAKGWTRSSYHLASGLAAGDGVVIRRDIRPGEFWPVTDLDNPLASLEQRYDEDMGLQERIAETLRSFVEGLGGMLRPKERGGPGSGHHGHRGRPGKVGGSLPRGVTAPPVDDKEDEIKRLEEEAQTIGGRRGAFARMVKKFQRILDDPLDFDVVRAGGDLSDAEMDAIAEELSRYGDWEGKAEGITNSIYHALLRFKEMRLEDAEGARLDEQALDDMRYDLRMARMDNWVATWQSDIERELDEWYSGVAGWEGVREKLGIDDETFTQLSTSAVRAEVYQRVFMDWYAGEGGGLERYAIFDPVEHLDRLASQDALDHTIEMANETMFEMADDWVERPTNEELEAEFGTLPTETFETTRPADGHWSVPEGWHVVVGREDDGEIVSAMIIREYALERKIPRALFASAQANDASEALLDVDYDRDVSGRDYYLVDYLASKRHGRGYGTETMLQALNMAAEDNAGIFGESLSEAAGFYEKIGGKFVRADGNQRGGLTFWTPRDVQRAASWLRRANTAMNLGLGRVLSFVTRAAGDRVERLGFNVVALMLIDDDPAGLMSTPTRDQIIESHTDWVRTMPRTLTERHYSPIHPGTGTDQSVHGGGGGGAATAVEEPPRRVGLTSARPGKEAEQVYGEAEAFEDLLTGLAGVRDARVEPGMGGWEGGSEPTWVVEFSGDGEATSLIAETAKQYNQDAAVVFEPCGDALEDCQNIAEFDLGRKINETERRQIEQTLVDNGIGGWTWYRDERGDAGLFVSEIREWGTVMPESKIEELRNHINQLGYDVGLETGKVKVVIMEREGPNGYDRYIEQ